MSAMVDPDELEVGSRVRLVGMPPDSELDGCVGTLSKTIGSERVAVMLDGKDKTTVVNRRNLEPCTAPPPYSIVGTWDDWEPHAMQWRPELACYEYSLALGEKGLESFKFLQENDWDRCVYPSRGARSEVCGPDKGGLDAEWTIGPGDGAAPGVRFTVRLSFTALRPEGVTWERCPEPRGPQRKVDFRDDVPEVASRAEEPPRPRPARQAFSNSEAVKKAERLARERLARRLEEAEERQVKAITDLDTRGTLEHSEREQAKINDRLAENRKRYHAQYGAWQGKEQNAIWGAPSLSLPGRR